MKCVCVCGPCARMKSFSKKNIRKMRTHEHCSAVSLNSCWLLFTWTHTHTDKYTPACCPAWGELFSHCSHCDYFSRSRCLLWCTLHSIVVVAITIRATPRHTHTHTHGHMESRGLGEHKRHLIFNNKRLIWRLHSLRNLGVCECFIEMWAWLLNFHFIHMSLLKSTNEHNQM